MLKLSKEDREAFKERVKDNLGIIITLWAQLIITVCGLLATLIALQEVFGL